MSIPVPQIQPVLVAAVLNIPKISLLVFDTGNMILLCDQCHQKMRGKEKSWKKKLLNLL